MYLTKGQSDFFFSVYLPLLYYSYTDIEYVDSEDFFEDEKRQTTARYHLYTSRYLIDDYIDDVNKKSKIEERKLNLLNEIKRARYSDFIVVEKNELIYFIDYRAKNKIYKITGLSQDINEIFPAFPCLTVTAIFQFEDKIISDGLNIIRIKKYPKNAAKAIFRDFDEDFSDNFRINLYNANENCSLPDNPY